MLLSLLPLIFSATAIADGEYFIARFEIPESSKVSFRSMIFERSGVKRPPVKKAEKFDSDPHEFLASDEAGNPLLTGVTGFRKYLGYAPDATTSRVKDENRSRSFYIPYDLKVARIKIRKSGSDIYDQEFSSLLKTEAERYLKQNDYFGKVILRADGANDLSQKATLAKLVSELGKCEFAKAEQKAQCIFVERAASYLNR